MKAYRIQRKEDGQFLGVRGRITKKGKVWIGTGALKNAIHGMTPSYTWEPNHQEDLKTFLDKHIILEYDLTASGRIIELDFK